MVPRAASRLVFAFLKRPRNDAVSRHQLEHSVRYRRCNGPKSNVKPNETPSTLPPLFHLMIMRAIPSFRAVLARTVFGLVVQRVIL